MRNAILSLSIALSLTLGTAACAKRNHTNIAQHNVHNTFIFDFEQTITKSVQGFELLKIASEEQRLSKETNRIIEEEIRNSSGVSTKIYDRILTRMSKFNIKVKQRYFDHVVNKATLTDGIDMIIKDLIKNGNNVIIIGGGYGGCNVIPRIVEKLGVKAENIYSGEKLNINADIQHATNQGYVNCKTGEMLVNDGQWRKSLVIKKLKENKQLHGKVIHIGDGENDLETWKAKAVDYFIGFGVNIAREAVQKEAPMFVTTIKEFKKLIESL